MSEIQNKKQLVEALVNTFKDRDHLHECYKEKMKQIIGYAFSEFATYANDHPMCSGEDIQKWICDFVEERFKPADI